jgi:release factor glutamine methyltransferase
MAETHVHDIGRHSVVLADRATVGPPTPYTLLLAESIPALPGASVAEIGTGSGILAIVAALQGAARVRVVDTNPAAIEAAVANAGLNGVADRIEPLAVGASIIPLPEGETVDLVISNPAQLPLPAAAEAHNPYYAGPDGRRMIDAVIAAAPGCLAPGGRLLMVLNSVTDFPASLAAMRSAGLEPRVVGERSLVLRPLFDRPWLDHLGGAARGLYSLRDGVAYETIYAVSAQAG